MSIALPPGDAERIDAFLTAQKSGDILLLVKAGKVLEVKLTEGWRVDWRGVGASEGEGTS